MASHPVFRHFLEPNAKMLDHIFLQGLLFFLDADTAKSGMVCTCCHAASCKKSCWSAQAPFSQLHRHLSGSRHCGFEPLMASCVEKRTENEDWKVVKCDDVRCCRRRGFTCCHVLQNPVWAHKKSSGTRLVRALF